MVESLSKKASRKPVVLVTGTSSGIGLELAKKLYSMKQYRVVATSRERSLKNLTKHGLHENENFIHRALDVTSYANRRSLIQEIIDLWDGVDVLINNAGISYRAVVEHMSDEEEYHQMETNYLGAMSLIRLCLPKMRERLSGQIINVSSVSGLMAMPTMSSYSASKFALEGASEALWYELRPWNIKVSCIQPGFIRSDSFRNVYYSKKSSECSIDRSDPYCQYYADMEPFVEKLMKSSLTDAEDIAKKILCMMKEKSPALRVPATLDARLFFWIRRLLPRSLYHRVLYRGLPGAKNWSKLVSAAHPKDKI